MISPFHQSRRLALELSARCSLVTLELVRNLRGCDATTVLISVGDSLHPQCLRWVFNLAANATDARRRELRFWKEEVLASSAASSSSALLVLACLEPAVVIEKILGPRPTFPRGEIEVQWTISAMTITRLVRTGQLVENDRCLTRASLATFLNRRLQ